MKRNYGCHIFLAVIIWLSATGYAGIYNGGFEIIDPNTSEPFDTPDGWERENYTAVLEQFVPQPQQGNVDGWSIDIEEGLWVVQGQLFVVLSTGDFNPEPTSAYIRQYVYVYPGETLAGYYFFGTADYIPYNDYAAIELVPADSNSGLSDITVVHVEVNDVDKDPRDTDGKSMEGWEYFERTFDSNEGGAYNLTISITDVGDQYFPSYIAVDGMTLCNRPPAGDINHDCHVNFVDFSRMATDWFQDCSDPNYLADPNNNCSWGTDLDGSGPVDLNDLKLMGDNWLYSS
jgi:hypothetical protein